MAVSWHFSLLPRWAIAVVIARELFMLVRAATRSHAVSTSRSIGRAGSAWPRRGAPFFAMAGVHWLALVMLYVGMALALTATVLYVDVASRDASATARRGN